MICPECNQDNVEMLVSVHMVIPSSMENMLSKTNIRKKGVMVYGVNWDTASYWCRTEGCGWRHSNK